MAGAQREADKDTRMMRRIEMSRFGAADVLQLAEVPRPRPARGEVLIRVRAAGVNPKDCMVRKGKFQLFTGTRFPQGLGHDFAGEIAELGPGVDHLAPGTAVFGMQNGWRVGAYADYAIARPDALAHLPAGLAWEQAAAVPLAAQTALQALRDLADVGQGSRVLINGASGGVGTFAVQIAHALGAHVTAVCSQRNAELVRGLGADTVHDYNQTDPIDRDEAFDTWFDAFGNKSFPRTRAALTRHGQYITTVPSRANLGWSLATIVSIGRRGRLVLVHSRRRDLETLADWLRTGALHPIVECTYPLAQAAQAHDLIETKRVRGKVVLTP